jgi:hypothetical protein
MSQTNPRHAAASMLMHAVSMAFAGVFEGLYVTTVGGFGAWMAFDPHADRFGAFLLAGYALARITGFVAAIFTAVLLLLGAYSLSKNQRRFVFIAAVAGVVVPTMLVTVNLLTFNCCAAWVLPMITAVPATGLALGAWTHAAPAQPRRAWGA